MKRYRQWLAETEDHMTESPDGKWALYAEALADKEAAVKEWQDIAGQWEDKCQKLTEQIAALETAVKKTGEEAGRRRGMYCDSCNKKITKDNLGALAGPFRYCSECWDRYKRTGQMRKEAP